jgi:serine/threonine-protein phosphatase 2A regulatory subunit B''
MDVAAFRQVTREVCELPSFFTPLLMHRIAGTDPIVAADLNDSTAAHGPRSPTAPAADPAPVTLAQFTGYWRSTLAQCAEANARVFEVMRGSGLPHGGEP